MGGTQLSFEDAREATGASVAAVSDTGPREYNQDRAFTALSAADGSWVIAVADGLGGHVRGEEAAQAAIDSLPDRIADRAEMVDAFVEANRRVLTLTDAGSTGRPRALSRYPMSTLSVAAWTPEGGLLIAWLGDTLPFVVWRSDDGAFSGQCCGLPHRFPAGSISRCLGMPAPSLDAAAEQVAAEVEFDEPLDADDPPDAVVLCSDGAWEPYVHRLDRDWLFERSPEGGIGAVLPANAADATAIAESVLAGAKKLRLNDNTTVAAALTA